jgi:apolipoprotein D and lipocalin family protein
MTYFRPPCRQTRRTRFLPSSALAVILTLGALTAMSKEPVSTVSHVDLPRFMGTWYVIASIPTIFEKHAFNATESYALNPDGTIAVTFQFHKGSFDGPLKTMKPRGFVRDASAAYWGMQFFWPFKSEYRIAYLDDAYTRTIIARTARDYVWIMARQPQVSPAEYERLVKSVADLGYDTSKLILVPQRWP